MLIGRMNMAPDLHQLQGCESPQGLPHGGVGKLAEDPLGTSLPSHLLCVLASLGEADVVGGWIDELVRANVLIRDGVLCAKCPLVSRVSSRVLSVEFRAEHARIKVVYASWSRASR